MPFMTLTARNLTLRSHFGDARHPSALSTLYFALFTQDPFTVSGAEVPTANGYARAAVANTSYLWGTIATTDDFIVNKVAVSWPNPTGPWASGQQIAAWGIMSAATGGTLWYAASLNSNQQITVPGAGSTPRLPAGAIVLRQDG